MPNKANCPFYEFLITGAHEPKTETTATGVIPVPFRLDNKTLMLALPISQLRDVLNAFDAAHSGAVKEAAEAAFRTGSHDTNHTNIKSKGGQS